MSTSPTTPKMNNGRARDVAQGTATLAVEVGARLRADIVEGRLYAGRKIGLKNLTDIYGVGVAPIREALFKLSAEGLVEANARRGFMVSRLSMAELHDVTMLRQTLDSISLRKSIETGNTAWEARILSAFHHLSKSEPRGSSDWHDWHRRFHNELLSGHEAPVTQRLREQLFDMSHRYRHLVIALHSDQRDTLSEHHEIMTATLKRDADRAVSLLVDHYGRTANTVADYIKKEGMEG